jgi:hypothetical protein
MPAVNSRNNLISTIVFACLFVVFLKTCFFRNHENLQGVIWSDAEGYYMYLPAVFIQKSLHHVPYRSMNARQNEKGEIVRT